MTLEDLYEALSTGELSQVILGNDGDGVMEIPEDKRRQIRLSAQLGLSDLHTRFLIKEKSLTVELEPDRSVYTLEADDLLKVERIYDDQGRDVALNEVDNDLSVRTPTDTTIAVPEALCTKTLTVYYRANHPPLNKYVADAAPIITPIDLPLKYLQALLYFIAARALNPIGFGAERTHEGNNFAQKYELECLRLTELGAGIETVSQNRRPLDSGWV